MYGKSFLLWRLSDLASCSSLFSSEICRICFSLLAGRITFALMHSSPLYLQTPLYEFNLYFIKIICKLVVYLKAICYSWVELFLSQEIGNVIKTSRCWEVDGQLALARRTKKVCFLTYLLDQMCNYFCAYPVSKKKKKHNVSMTCTWGLCATTWPYYWPPFRQVWRAERCNWAANRGVNEEILFGVFARGTSKRHKKPSL